MAEDTGETACDYALKKHYSGLAALLDVSGRRGRKPLLKSCEPVDVFEEEQETLRAEDIEKRVRQFSERARQQIENMAAELNKKR